MAQRRRIVDSDAIDNFATRATARGLFLPGLGADARGHYFMTLWTLSGDIHIVLHKHASSWIVGKPEVIQVEPISNDKSASRHQSHN
jgi:hypothetical protein